MPCIGDLTDLQSSFVDYTDPDGMSVKGKEQRRGMEVGLLFRYFAFLLFPSFCYSFLSLFFSVGSTLFVSLSVSFGSFFRSCPFLVYPLLACLIISFLPRKTVIETRISTLTPHYFPLLIQTARNLFPALLNIVRILSPFFFR